MLKAEAGSSESKQLENEGDQALMNANVAWHWGQGDHDADLSDDDCEDVKQLGGPAAALELTWDPASGDAPPPPPEGCSSIVLHESSAAAGAGAGALAIYSEEKAKSTKR